MPCHAAPYQSNHWWVSWSCGAQGLAQPPAWILMRKGMKPTCLTPATSACRIPHGEKENKPISPMDLTNLFQPGKSISDLLSILASTDVTEHNTNEPDPQEEVYSQLDRVIIAQHVAMLPDSQALT